VIEANQNVAVGSHQSGYGSETAKGVRCVMEYAIADDEIEGCRFKNWSKKIHLQEEYSVNIVHRSELFTKAEGIKANISPEHCSVCNR